MAQVQDTKPPRCEAKRQLKKRVLRERVATPEELEDERQRWIRAMAQKPAAP
jgi:hypothetical protein